MKAVSKRISVMFFVALYAFALLAGILFSGMASLGVFADEKNVGRTYYYEELNDFSKKFYNAINDMAKSGDLKKGDAEYDLIAKGVISESDAQGYVNGLSKVPVAFSCARDAYYMDHPELFYVDIYKLTLSAGTMGDNYVCYIDAGREENYYLKDGGLDSEEKINAAIEKFNDKVNEIANAANSLTDAVAKISYVNKAICEAVQYDFCSDDTAAAAHIQTAYGALVNGKAVCGGYAGAFKAVMDKLDIPCVLIQGSALPADGSGYAAHMWNAVKLDGMWYGVDTTWNDTDKPEKPSTERYFLVGSGTLNKTHREDGVISTSGFRLKYPALKPYAYGVDEDANGMKITGEYIKLEGDKSTSLFVSCSYDGKGARKLADEGKYLAFRTATLNDETGAIDWSNWCSAVGYYDYYKEGVGDNFDQVFKITDTHTKIYLNNSEYGIQFVIFDYAPEGATKSGVDYVTANIKPENIIADYSVVYENTEYLNYIPAPYPKKITPGDILDLDKQRYTDITITYGDKLVWEEDETELKIKVTSKYEDIEDFVDIEYAKFDEASNSISFRFWPSTQYTHDWLAYNFVPTNLVGEKSGKNPIGTGIIAKREIVMCNKILPGGQLYIKAYGEPSLIADEDMSSSFTDGNEKVVMGGSQLMLVVDNAVGDQETQMKDMIKDKPGVDASSAATYEINLHSCGILAKIPEGAYVQVGFGFPAGYQYDPSDNGKTFKVYHYKEENGKTVVEEVPCVVTEYGIMATVKSFSPFAVVAADKDSVSGKSIYAQRTEGGSVFAGENKTGVVDCANGVTYTITPDSGYEIESVLLNGEDVKNRVSGGNLTLAASELDASNKIDVSFVSKKSVQKYADKGVSIARPVITVTASDIPEAIGHDSLQNGLEAWAIAVIVIAVVVAVAGAGAVTYFMLRKKSPAKSKK